MAKRIIITGAASGIGEALVGMLAADGPVALTLVDRDAVGLERVAAGLGDAAQIALVSGDLGDPAFCESIVETTVARFGGVDGLVSNAGITKGAPLAELSVADFELSFAVNTRPTWLIAKAAYPHLRVGGGAIVATGSLAATNPTPPLGAYAASKAALLMLVRQIAIEWGPDGIRCNCVSPGPTLTPLTSGYADPALRAERESVIPLRKLGQPQEIAATIAFLLGDRASHITGQNINVDGGMGWCVMPLSGSGPGQPRKG